MPQLNPAPWFLILTFSWIIILTIVTPKIVTHITPNKPSIHESQQPKTNSWTWPWH
nr:ATP synthase protein 8 [Acyrtops beryllinus]